MKYLFLVIVFLHGLIHLLGFVKGFELKEVKELTLPISKTLGVVWLTATILFLTYGFLYMLNSKYAWLIGLVAVVVSQVIIFLFWKDARFGTIPNIIILAVSIFSFGAYSFEKMIEKETAQLLNKNVNAENRILNEADLVNLPVPAKNWLKNCGALGKPFISMGKVTQTAEMQMKPDQNNWLTATATQYTTIDNPAFI